MRDFATFRKGGVHPAGRKDATREIAIHNAVLPRVATIPLHQHIGSRSECVVSPGDMVREGMVIGTPTGFVSVAIHSSIPGRVTEVDEIVLPSGLRTPAVRIELEGEFDRLGKLTASVDWRTLGREAILKILQEYGIVGMGGATFPTHVKYSVPKGSKVETFVVNGVECEPYLSADHRIMLERTSEIFEGIEIVRSVLDPARVVFAVEANKNDAIAALRAYASKNSVPVEVIELQVKYPQGDEKQILQAITGREVPSGGLPIDIGAVVTNVSTVNAIYEAVALGKPLIERVLTVSGGAIAKPGNYKVRIGTPFRQLIEECGGFDGIPEKIIAGGPMMGFPVLDLDTPVTKGTSGILVLSKSESRSARVSPCISCGRCISVCPLGLNPTRLYKHIDHTAIDAAVAEGLMDCKECGCCGYTCPSHIPLVQGMRLGKQLHVKRKRAGR